MILFDYIHQQLVLKLSEIIQILVNFSKVHSGLATAWAITPLKSQKCCSKRVFDVFLYFSDEGWVWLNAPSKYAPEYKAISLVSYTLMIQTKQAFGCHVSSY